MNSNHTVENAVVSLCFPVMFLVMVIILSWENRVLPHYHIVVGEHEEGSCGDYVVEPIKPVHL